MGTTNKAFFISRPRNLTDLKTPHQVELEKSFSISKRLNLTRTDYENFASDLLVERNYIANYAGMCKNDNDELECIFISQPNDFEGVLVVPDENGFIEKAAFYKKAPNCPVEINRQFSRTTARRFQSRKQRIETSIRLAK